MIGVLGTLLSVHLTLGACGLATANGYYMLFVIISSLLYAWLVYFFRDPYRTTYRDENCVVAPSDGKIVFIQEVYEDEYLHENRLKVSIFMSPWDVHTTRSPISGVVKFFKYHPGKYWVAWHPKSSTKNERTTVVIEHANGEQILFRQIAGFLARRVVCYTKEMEKVKQGNECGFIKLGSRVDIFIPRHARIEVILKQKVKGGVSVLARW